jgi:hypothetical protein
LVILARSAAAWAHLRFEITRSLRVATVSLALDEHAIPCANHEYETGRRCDSPAICPDPNVEVSSCTRSIQLIIGVPGSFCTSEDETNWNERSYLWHEGRSTQRSRL